MIFEIDVAGRRHVLTVEPIDAAGPTGGRFRVAVRTGGGADLQVGPTVANGAPDEVLDLDVRPTDLGLSLIDRVTGRVVDVAVTERPAGQWLLQFPAGSITAIVDGRLSGTRGGAAGTAGAQRVTAPMPGRIVRVLVQPGDEVTARQGLMVIEAMKMENELTAVRGGRIREVTVAPGAAVEAGRLLVVIE
jgi:biotin carboxyl carrier protein